ncbi:hypothetical protein QUF83_03320 [Bacillus cereus]|uniref:LGFP repeat-containing protein n=1 Tax=Bacillus cereus TaxID=1396 RepID=UPI0025A1D580|nr:hypothetical protein [Bacillus cereus]MDM5235260.1 hypothetical protein [Bacillus cereus]
MSPREERHPIPEGTKGILEINMKYEELGRNNVFLGTPISDVQNTADGLGMFMHFQGGTILWHPDTGAHEVHGAIRDKYEELSWERSFLGYPLTDESPTVDGVGRYNHFQGGTILWHPDTGAHEVHGAIRDKYEELGWERSFLGYPTSDEIPSPDGNGQINVFQRGNIKWTTQSGAESIPRVAVFETNRLEANTVHGWAKLSIQSDGFWSYSGHVHENGFIGHNFDLGVVLNFVDSAGKAYGFSHNGTISGTVGVESRDEDWGHAGFREEIIEQWDILRKSGIRSTLHVSTDPLQVGAAFLWGLLATVGAIGVTLFSSDPNTKCGHGLIVPDNSPGDMGYEFRCEQNS